MSGIAKAEARLPSLADALKVLARLEVEIDRSETFLDLDRVANTAAGLQRMFKRTPELADRAGIVFTKAETKVGIAWEAAPKATGGDAQRTRFQKGTSRQLTLTEIGLNKKRAARALKLAAMPAEQQAAIFDKLAEEGKPIAPSTVLAAMRQKTKREKIHAVSTAAFSEDGPFGTVVIDPPWPMQKIDRDVRLNQDAFDYPVMSEAAITRQGKRDLALYDPEESLKTIAVAEAAEKAAIRAMRADPKDPLARKRLRDIVKRKLVEQRSYVVWRDKEMKPRKSGGNKLNRAPAVQLPAFDPGQDVVHRWAIVLSIDDARRELAVLGIEAREAAA